MTDTALAGAPSRAARYLLARLREPSTHAGIAAMLVLLGVLFPTHKDVFVAVGGVFAAIAAGTPDATSTATDAPAPALAAEAEKGPQS